MIDMIFYEVELFERINLDYIAEDGTQKEVVVDYLDFERWLRAEGHLVSSFPTYRQGVQDGVGERKITLADFLMDAEKEDIYLMIIKFNKDEKS